MSWVIGVNFYFNIKIAVLPGFTRSVPFPTNFEYLSTPATSGVRSILFKFWLPSVNMHFPWFSHVLPWANTNLSKSKIVKIEWSVNLLFLRTKVLKIRLAEKLNNYYTPSFIYHFSNISKSTFCEPYHGSHNVNIFYVLLLFPVRLVHLLSFIFHVSIAYIEYLLEFVYPHSLEGWAFRLAYWIAIHWNFFAINAIANAVSERCPGTPSAPYYITHCKV